MSEIYTQNELMFDSVSDTGIDSFIFVVEKPRVFKLLKSLEIKEKLRLTTRNKSINEWAKKKFASQMGISNFSGSAKHPFRMRYINFKRANKSLTNTLILIENSVELNELCRKRKKAYGTYAMVVFAGLYQPTREIKPLTHKILRAFLKKFNVWEMDYAKDIYTDEKELRKEKFIKATKDISKDEKKVFALNGTIYANSCKGEIKRVFIYDKFLKETTYHRQKLCKVLDGWKRIEMRVGVRKRFSKISFSEIERFNDLLDSVAREYSWMVLFGVARTTLDRQLAYFRDARRRIKSGVKFKEWVA